jgi:F-type H+-transporting ATPase subunit b
VNPLVQPDPGLYIWTIVTFLVLLFLLSKFAWVPLLAILTKRQQTIAAAVEDARRAREDLERVQQDSAKLLAERQIQQETARALAQIRTEAVELSLDIASKILRRTVTKADHEQLIADVVEHLDRPAH